MKNLLKGLCLCLMLAVGFGLVQVSTPAAYNAYADTTATESAYAKVSTADMVGIAVDGATYDATTGNITNVASYGRFGFGPKYENVEVTSTVRFTTAGNTTFTLRGQGTGLAAANAWSTNSGYMVRWYPHGQFEFYKNATLVSGPFWGPLPAMAAETDYTVVFKTVNMSDGSVQVLLTINGLTVVNHNDPINDNGTTDDTTDDVLPITGAGWYAMTSEGSVFSVSGTKRTVPIVNLSDVAPAVGSDNFAGATVDENGVVTATGTGIQGYSGVGYTFYNSGTGYGYKATVTPKAAAGRLVFTIGSYKANTASFNRPSVIDATWGWTDPGYVFYWSANGQRHFARGSDSANLLEYSWNCPAYVADTAYTIEYTMIPFDDGSVRITFKINNTTVLDYLDIPVYGTDGTATYTPAKLVNDATSSTGRITNALLLTVSVEATFAPIDPITVSEKTVITSDLGTGVSASGSTFDRNGAVEVLQGARAVGYNANLSNAVVRFKTTFSSIPAGNPGISFLINYQGATLDQTNGGDWTTKGYAFKLYANGMTALVDGGATLFEGWNPWAYPGVGLGASTEYLIEIGTVTNGTDYTRVWLKINNAYVFNYVDTTTPVTGGGWLAVHNDGGYVGNMKPYGIEIPVVTTDIAAGENAGINAPVTLSYTMSGATDSDVVTYYVDTTKSTATANISGNVVTPLTEGNLVVYACVNGVYSEDVTFAVEQQAYAVVTNLPTSPIVVGGESVTIDGKMSDDSTVTTKSFRVENISGRATINATTGQITAIAAGTIKVYVTINGLESEGNIITVIPKIEIKNATAMAVGGVLNTLGYIANCDLPNESITATYELTEGSEYVDFDATTGYVKALNIGIFGVRVIITGETFQASSPVCRIAIEEPIIVINDGTVEDMYVGQKMLLYPHISQGGITITEVDLVVSQGDKLITYQVVEQLGKKYIEITAVKAGVVRVKPKVNGTEGVQESEFTITKLEPTIIVSNTYVGRTQTLSVMFNSDDYVYESVVYTIVEGSENATIDGNILTGTKIGKVTVRAVIDDLYEVEATIDITGRVIVKGVSDGQSILVGSKVQLNYYMYDQEGAVSSVEYVLVEGDNYAVLTEDGLLVTKKIGQVKVKVIVDGIESGVVTLHIYQNTSKLVGYIVLGSVLVLGVLSGATAGIVFGVKKFKLKKASANNTKVDAEASQTNKEEQAKDSQQEVKKDKKAKVEQQPATEQKQQNAQPKQKQTTSNKSTKNTQTKSNNNQTKKSTNNTNKSTSNKSKNQTKGNK